MTMPRTKKRLSLEEGPKREGNRFLCPECDGGVLVLLRRNHDHNIYRCQCGARYKEWVATAPTQT
jgi:hypothetical protein